MKDIENAYEDEDFGLNEDEVVKLFWDSHPDFQPYYDPRKSHNDYNTDIRTSFVFFVDFIRRDNIISEQTARAVTL